jgi:phosphonate transport system substrate-binding protein
VRPLTRVFRLALAAAALATWAQGADPVHLRVGYSAQTFVEVDLDEARAVTRLWSEKILARKFTDGAVETVILEDTDAMLQGFREERIDLAALVSDEYLRLRDRVALDPVFVTAHAGGVYSQIVLVVRRDADLGQLQDLRGKRLSISVEQAGTIHSLWLANQLLRADLPDDQAFFGSRKEATRTSQAILTVFFGQADACLTTRESFGLVSELNPQVGRDLKILIGSPDLASGVVVFRRGYDAVARGKLVESLATLHQDSQGRQLLRLFRMDRLVPYEESQLESVAALLAEQRALLLAGRP